LNWRWLPSVLTSCQPSASRSRITSRTFTGRRSHIQRTPIGSLGTLYFMHITIHEDRRRTIPPRWFAATARGEPEHEPRSREPRSVNDDYLIAIGRTGDPVAPLMRSTRFT
jgi:hypothetical protein